MNSPKQNPSTTTTRVYLDMVGDLFHYGHMRFIQQVRKAAQELFPHQRIHIIVGVTADVHLQEYKRKPCTSNSERCETIRGCKYVDAVLPSVPLITTGAFMDAHQLDCVFHGDDYTAKQIATYYGEIQARKAYYSVPYSSEAVSTTTLLQTAAARQAAFLSKVATTAAATTTANHRALVSAEQVSGFTFRAYAGPLVDATEGERLMDLLHQYGAHYKNIFGPDMTWRLFHGNSNNQSGLRGWSAWCVAPTEPHSGAAVPFHSEFLRNVCVSNCSVICNEVQKAEDVRVGLFGMVITAPRYRRRGVSTSLVSRVLRDWDVHCPKGWLVLGTGSPHAAQLYANNGFVHCNGGLDQATKGYNPDDVGEWIMIRPPCGSGSSSSSSSSGSSSSPSGFDREQFILDFYCHEEQEELFELVQLDRCYWAELCLLFNLDVKDANKLKSQGISTGVQVEEQMLKMINEKCPRNFVCLDRAMGRVHGVASFDAGTGSYDCYALPGMDTVRKMLENFTYLLRKDS